MSSVPHQDVCYLCGAAMGMDRTRDHVPAQSFFPPDLRRKTNFSRLDVVQAHKKCNSDYQVDEQYFFHTLAPLARRTEAGPAIWSVVDKPVLTPRELTLRQKVAREFSVGTDGRIHKTYDKQRVDRVIKKIIRGLWFIHFKQVMPEQWRCDVAAYDPDNPPPASFLQAIENQPSGGHHPEVFFFKSVKLADGPLYGFTLFFWDWFVFVVTIHGELCACPKCAARQSTAG